jgi:hypothetical protein
VRFVPARTDSQLTIRVAIFMDSFIELLVRGALALLIAAVKLLNTAVEDVASAIETAIKSSVDVINTFLSTSIAALNDLLAVIGQSITVPVVAQPDLSALSNVTLPSSFESALLSLNSSLPTLDELWTEVNALIETPFETLKADVNSSEWAVTESRYSQLC